MLDCASCQTTNPEGSQFCGACGAPLRPERNCPSCNVLTGHGQRFCHSCGFRLSSPDPEAVAVGDSPNVEIPEDFGDGRYRVQRYLGEGGKKRVYLGRDTQLNRDVAVSVIKKDGLEDDGLLRVRREVEAMGELGQHPHIVTVFDVREDEGQLYMVSEYLSGGDVEQKIAQAENGILKISEALKIAEEICGGLEHAHARGIIHRDLKPGNIWLAEDGTAKLGDFGLAVSLEQSRLTQEGLIVGTVAYMAPEQALGQHTNARSDLYALGAVLYEMVTGRPPFMGDGVVSIISQHINTPPVAPTLRNARVSPALETLILQLLQKDPDARPESAKVVREAIQAISQGAIIGAAALRAMNVNPLDRLAGGVFVGRDDEIKRLRIGVDQILSRRGCVRMLVGEPGIGKTRTSEELTTYAKLRGAKVIWGRCYEGEGAPAYWPWVQILRASVENRSVDEVREALGVGAAEIARLSPEIQQLLPDLPDAGQLEAQAARFRLFDAITTYLKNLSKLDPLVLVLDDLHWADESSLLLLQFFVREIRESSILVLGTYRDVELNRTHPLAETIATLTREQLSERVLLRGLRRQDVERFFEMTAGRKPPDGLADAIYTETEGNPFFVQELVRLLVAEGRLDDHTDGDSWSLTIPQGVREVIGRRLNQMDDCCNEVLTIASVVGREFETPVLAKVADFDDERIKKAMDAALAAQVITRDAHHEDRYRFSHALIRETLYEELSTPKRVKLHQKIGQVLEEACVDCKDDRLSEIAHHYFQSLQTGQVDRALRYLIAAAEHSSSQHAYEDALVHYGRALQALELQDPVDEVRRGELMIALGSTQTRVGRHIDASRTFDRAAVHAEAHGTPEQFANAAIGYARLVIFRSDDPRAYELIQQALERISDEDSALRARALGLFALVGRWKEPELSSQRAHAAVEMARRVGDKSTLIHCLDDLHIVLIGSPDIQERLSVAGELIDTATEIGDLEVTFAGYVHRTSDTFQQGNIAQVEADLKQLDQLAAMLRQPLRSGTVLRIRIALALLRGELGEVDKLTEAVRELANTQQVFIANRLEAVQTTVFHILSGNYDDAVQTMVGQMAIDPEPGLRSILALAYIEAGRDAEARFEFNQAIEHAQGEQFEYPVISRLTALARVSVGLGRTQDAQEVYDRLLPFSGQMASLVFFLSFGAVDAYLGLLATLLARWDDAERFFDAGIRLNEQCGALPFAATARYDYAQFYLARQYEGDVEKALDLLNRALETAQKLGMRGLVERVLASKLEIQGIEPDADIRNSIQVVTSSVSKRRLDFRDHASSDGRVTLIFSDMAGFTEMTERLGDREAHRVIQAHNRIVRQAVRENHGYEVELQGDGFLLAFSNARHAVDGAIAIQRKFQQYSASHPEQPIRVRMGIHTGEAIQDADRFFGKTVILTSRIADQAKAGEILGSSALKEQVKDSDDLKFDEGRDLTLKGLAGEHHVYSLAWE